MKMHDRLILTTLLALGLLAQPVAGQTAPDSNNATAQPPPAVSAPTTAEVPAAVTNAPANPAPKAEKKATPKKKKKKSTPKPRPIGADLKSVPLVPGPASVIASNVNVRGQAKLKSEVITRIQKGQPLTVLEEVTLKNSGPDEPSAWAKILLPSTAHVWVNASFIEPVTQIVQPAKLNVRGGPGENFSILNRLKHGDIVKPITSRNGWLQIEPPPDTIAFVAAQYLRQDKQDSGFAIVPGPSTNALAVAANTTPPTAVPDQPPIAPPTEPTLPVTDQGTNATALNATTNAVPANPDEPPPPRIVLREGLVRGTTSIQAPTKFELISPENGRTINYLYTTSRELDLRRYKGLHIIVTGEEGLDDRWHNTPVITIQKIQVLE
jgi:hypothetical protein